VPIQIVDALEVVKVKQHQRGPLLLLCRQPVDEQTFDRHVKATPVEQARQRIPLGHAPLPRLGAEQSVLEEVHHHHLARHGDREGHDACGIRSVHTGHAILLVNDEPRGRTTGCAKRVNRLRCGFRRPPSERETERHENFGRSPPRQIGMIAARQTPSRNYATTLAISAKRGGTTAG
jgi:hypothetical protein